ncbi:Uncharacterised protein [Mycobacteroides abscessus subsp. massiliense]|uniref:hypothetical protein n=1 Tax=Mycobacteroides abscessus TaxID=36809 RepID=UPI0009D08E69|nr:hypothetical protein [Mycobacteroides abscessus]SKF92783.1 Uncharacterised protein [Mycobacteroides abscessus subsp. massiliense]SKH14142.1 Uncharacterised protein [Mycobacteroides abscessus subsp. massiliense]SKJ39297.1 Uncharacterised protein [Mycobacteroides abscessus subsp. massiliense]SKJ75598.1 Uncharacterised protein [Mycobacteroides abscessus subsp. massiliense]SKL03136.1 Uncharacterised protein [Mycobacteroides abscessus subsp. massiliense]
MSFQGSPRLNEYLGGIGARAAARAQRLRDIEIQEKGWEQLVETGVADFKPTELVVGDQSEVTALPAKAVTIQKQEWGETFTVQGKQVDILFPYTGSGELWQYQASTFSISGWPLLDVDTAASHIVLTIKGEILDPSTFPDHVAKTLTTLREVASWVNRDLEQWTTMLRQELTNIIKPRFTNIAGLADVDAAHGIPIHRSGTDREIPVPLVRKPIPIDTAAASRTSTSGSRSPEHVLESAIFTDIVDTIEKTARAMERTPTASQLPEESLRNLLLIVLNANYEALRGEVFNGAGKTDLLLPWEGGNAFIGECKIWTGPKNFTSAVDQLLGYVTWRDTKAALIIFFKNRNPSALIESAYTTLSEHPHFISGKRKTETHWDCMIRAAADDQRVVTLALLGVPLIPS